MHRNRLLASILAIAVCLFATVSTASPQFKRSDSKVKIKATASKPSASGVQKITVNIKIEKGWHIYANPVDHDTLKSAATTLTVKGANIENVTIRYPKGIQKKDETFGNYNFYKKDVKITAIVRRVNAETPPLEISVRINACNEAKMQCLAESTVKFKLE